MKEQHRDEPSALPELPTTLADTSGGAETLLELLLDLKHDLGKHLLLPLSLLPPTATDAEFITTAHRALTRTRNGPAGAVAAVSLFERFIAELGTQRPPWPEFQDLVAAVAHACAWQPRLEQAMSMEGESDIARWREEDGAATRAQLLHDFREVGARIQELLHKARKADGNPRP